MKLVYLNQDIFNSAGMERMLTNKANYFAEKKGYEVYIITTDQNNRTPFFQLSDKIKIIDLGINYFEYTDNNIFKKVYLFFKKNREYRMKLNSILTALSPDIVITLMFKNLDFLYKIKDGSMKIVELHFSKNGRKQLLGESKWSRFHSYIYNVRGKIETKLIAKYDYFIILTEEDKKLWGTSLKNIKVIPNYLPHYPSKKALLEQKYVLSVGRLDYQKGYDILIPIWKEVVKKCPDWKLHIYGNGPMKSLLVEMIKKEDLTTSVSIFPPTKDILQKYSSSSIYVMSSRFEGLPLVLIEAMAAGLPAVSFKCKCGPTDVICDGVDGYLIEEGDKITYAEKLIELMEDENKRKKMGYSAHLNMQRYSEQNIMNQWESLFSLKITK
jgi:glycosyltransferase involved in cell wall biosynthesis